MPNTQKIAITMPIKLVEEIDALSKQKGVSRSRYITLAVFDKLEDEKRSFIKGAYDRIFSDEDILREQIETAKLLESVGSEGGQEW